MISAVSASLLLVASAGAQPVADDKLNNVEGRDLFFAEIGDGGFPKITIYNPTNKFLNIGDMKLEVVTQDGTTETVPLMDIIRDDSYEGEVGFTDVVFPRGHVAIGRGGYSSEQYGSASVVAAIQGLGNTTKSISLYLYNDLKDVLTIKPDPMYIREPSVCRGNLIDGGSSPEEWLPVDYSYDFAEDTYCTAFLSKDTEDLRKVKLRSDTEQRLQRTLREAAALEFTTAKKLRKLINKGLDLFISEINEGYGNNKYIEIYNPTEYSKRLNDVHLAISRNGKPSEFFEVLASGELKYDGSSPPPQLPQPILGEVPARGTFTICSVGFDGPKERCDKFDDDIATFNGNDSILLLQSGGKNYREQSVRVLDYFGDAGSASSFTVCGVAGASKNNVLRRRTTICKGNNEALSSFGTSRKDCEWVVSEATDYKEDLYYAPGIGKHFSFCGYDYYDQVRAFNIFDESD